MEIVVCLFRICGCFTLIFLPRLFLPLAVPISASGVFCVMPGRDEINEINGGGFGQTHASSWDRLCPRTRIVRALFDGWSVSVHRRRVVFLFLFIFLGGAFNLVFIGRIPYSTLMGSYLTGLCGQGYTLSTLLSRASTTNTRPHYLRPSLADFC